MGADIDTDAVLPAPVLPLLRLAGAVGVKVKAETEKPLHDGNTHERTIAAARDVKEKDGEAEAARGTAARRRLASQVALACCGCMVQSDQHGKAPERRQHCGGENGVSFVVLWASRCEGVKCNLVIRA